MPKQTLITQRIFKTSWFSKIARKVHISDDELSAFRDLAQSYAGLTIEQLAKLVQNRQFEEICNDNKT